MCGKPLSPNKIYANHCCQSVLLMHVYIICEDVLAHMIYCLLYRRHAVCRRYYLMPPMEEACAHIRMETRPEVVRAQIGPILPYGVPFHISSDDLLLKAGPAEKPQQTKKPSTEKNLNRRKTATEKKPSTEKNRTRATPQMPLPYRTAMPGDASSECMGKHIRHMNSRDSYGYAGTHFLLAEQSPAEAGNLCWCLC